MTSRTRRPGLSRPYLGAAPLCRVAERCGGCPRIGASVREQAFEKRERLRAALADLDVPAPLIRWVSHAGPVGYRNRIRLRVDGGRVVFFNSEKSHQCAVLETELVEALARLVAHAENNPADLLRIAHVELRTDESGGAPGLVLTPNEDALGEARLSLAAGRRLAAAGFAIWVVELGVHRADMPPLQRATLPGDGYAWVPLTSFRQVNRWTNRRLLGLLLRGARRRFGELRGVSFIDLFCGAGNFGLALLGQGAQGGFVERDAVAVSALSQAASEQGLEPEFLIDDPVEAALGGGPWPYGKALDLLVTNPPRAGLKSALASAIALGPRYVFCVYCDVDAWARDVRAWLGAGYVLEQLWAADMFPHTAHQETIAWLRRADCSGSAPRLGYESPRGSG